MYVHVHVISTSPVICTCIWCTYIFLQEKVQQLRYMYIQQEFPSELVDYRYIQILVSHTVHGDNGTFNIRTCTFTTHLRFHLSLIQVVVVLHL
jgi:succinate dehydrogenase hydrophobic anchor subunit